MSEQESRVLGTKLDILINDFQEFKKDQKETNRESRKHAVAEDRVQSRIETTVKWHTVIGTFMMGVLTYLVIESGV